MVILSVREFVRTVAKSELYKNKFFYNSFQTRLIELNYKHLLGRAPYDESEVVLPPRFVREPRVTTRKLIPILILQNIKPTSATVLFPIIVALSIQPGQRSCRLYPDVPLVPGLCQ